MIMFSFCSIGYLRGIITDFGGNIVTLFTMVFIYTLGGYMRLFNPLKDVRSIVIIVAMFLSVFAISVDYFNDVIVNIHNANVNGLNDIYQRLIPYGEYNIFVIIISVTLFELFSRIKIKTNAFINYVSSSTFIMYLIHDNPFVRQLWRKTNIVELYYNNYSSVIGLYILWIFIIFILGVALYSLYLLFVKLTKTKLFNIIINDRS